MSPSPTDALASDLQKEIDNRHVLAIVGAGVSMGATQGHPHASWTGLLESGVERCVTVAQPLPSGWEIRVRDEIHSGDMDDLLSAAEKISRKLGAPKTDYQDWLRETVGSLPLKDSSVLEALRELGIPIATTNYDGLLEKVTGLPPVTWRDGARIERVIRGEEPGILHLHGFWDEPESVILGIRSYEEILGDVHAQNFLHTLRTIQTFLFIGCGEGLADPNFGALLRWARKVFDGTGHAHYRLCRETEADGLRRQHQPEDRIRVLPYGPEHKDLAQFLSQRLQPTRSTGSAAGSSASLPTSSPRAHLLPPRPRIFGRDDEMRELVNSILSTPPLPVPVLGPPGMGKSTLTQAALHDHTVNERFGKRRYFVRCERATTRDALASEIAITLGLEPGPNTEARLLQELERAPALLVLDNTETPWERDTTAVEELLALLGAIEGVPLVASVRGEQRPVGPNWREAIRVRPLSLNAARDAFLAIAGQRHGSNPDLDPLLQAVDRLPLAITLLAYQAEGEPDLADLWRRWRDKRTAMLQRAGGRERLTNLELSLELSIQGPRMTKPAKRLLSLLGLLPDGVARDDLLHLLPNEGDEAASILRKVGLAIPQDVRLRVLAPVREHVQYRHPPQPEDLDRAMDHYLKLAELGERVGDEGGAEAIQRLSPEAGNLETIVLRALRLSDPSPGIKATLCLGELFRFTGLGSASLLEQARYAAEASGMAQRQAACIKKLGDIALRRSDHDAAIVLYNDALPLYQNAGNAIGEASCVKKLGDIALRRSKYQEARSFYQQAISLFQNAADVLGEANCIQRLGDIALRMSDFKAGRSCYEKTRSLYRGIGSVLGEANCIRRLGDIAYGEANYDAAAPYYEQARPLYKGIGDVLGEASCIAKLGELSLKSSNYEAAYALYQESLSLFRRVGDVIGEANCVQSLGDIAFERAEQETARDFFDKALGLYERIQDPHSIGWTHVRLARIASAPEDRDCHVKAAREAWANIKRSDLVGELDREFSTSKG
ncbi:MAG TPA: tetratricopeptide repeat protein [Thermoanaerobaculia bacterium]|nr:tetratricopeptide repeat protein [Thermoanaerobaculia bacterium]